MIVNVYCMPRVAFEIINVNLKIIFSRLRIYDFNGDLAWTWNWNWRQLAVKFSVHAVAAIFFYVLHTPLSHCKHGPKPVVLRCQWRVSHIHSYYSHGHISRPLNSASPCPPFILAAACLRAAFGCGTNGRAAFRLCPRCTRSDNIFFFFPFLFFFFFLAFIMLRARARLSSEEREGDGGRGVCLEACLPLPLPLHMQWGPALIKCFHVACFHFDVRHFEFFLSLACV